MTNSTKAIMILVFLTLFIALSIVFILSESCSRFFLIDFFVVTSGIQTYTSTKSDLRFKTGLQSVIKSYSDIFKSSDSCFTLGQFYCRNRKSSFLLFTFIQLDL